MTAIFKREIKAYFTSMLGYAFLVLFLCISGLFFYFTNIQNGYSSMGSYFNIMTYLCVLALPLLTARIFAEDRKLRTDQLILTAPVTAWAVAAGKYLSALVMFLIGTAVTLIYPVIIASFGDIPLAETMNCYFGFILLGSFYISAGAFISALTENQIVAAAITYAVLILLTFLGISAGYVPNETVVNIIMLAAPVRRYSAFMLGQLDISAVIYYLSLTGLFLFLTVQTFEKRRLG